MWLVGDEVTHARFLEVIGSSHSRTSFVDVWLEGVKVAEYSTEDVIESGTVRVTARNRERRSLDLVAKEGLWPVEATDPFSPYGMWLTVRVRVSAGRTVFPDVPVFAGKVLDVRRQRWSGKIAVKAVDPMWQVNREAIESPRPAPSGDRITTGIGFLLREVFPAATVHDISGALDAIPASTLWNSGAGSRGRTIDELAASVGAEVYARPTAVAPAGDFVIRLVPNLDGTVAWTLPDGAASIVVDDQQVQSGAAVVNKWIVTVERPDAPPIYVQVADEDAASPTRYGGPMGKLVDFYASSLIASEGQAQVAGRAKLARTKGLARTRQVVIAANPALEAGDVLSIGVDGEIAETHIADDFDIPLSPEQPAMNIQTRSTVGNQ